MGIRLLGRDAVGYVFLMRRETELEHLALIGHLRPFMLSGTLADPATQLGRRRGLCTGRRAELAEP